MFGEDLAPDESDAYTMGSTLLFQAVDVGQPVAFVKPSWADTYTEEDLKLRDHQEVSSGYWWIELGGKDLDTIGDAERDPLPGSWPRSTECGTTSRTAATTAPRTWTSRGWARCPGKRESRRLLGDYVLTERDALSGRVFDDAVAYGGWSLDLHAVGGL